MSLPALQALGGLRLGGPDGELLVGRKKELALLVYVARRAPRPVSREELVGLLWGDRPEANARQSLRQALLHLRQAANGLLVVEPEHVLLAPGRVELDVAAFEADLTAGRLDRAVERWAGEFLAGAEDVGGAAYRLWVEEEREALRKRLGFAFERLVASGSADRAVHWAERWTQAMPLDERAHSALVEALGRAERFDEALGRHAAFVTRFTQELGLAPSDHFLRLGRTIERRARPKTAPRLSPGSTALFTPDLVGRRAALDQLDAAWHAARSGTATVVLVEGEEGIGKTRLCEEFLRVMGDRSEPTVLLRARAHEATREAAGGVARELLGELRDAPGLVGSPAGALAALGVLVPGIRERLRLAAPPTAWPADEAVGQVLRDVATELPIVLFLDDFPAADRATQDLLLAVAERLRKARVLMLLTARSGDASSSPAWIALRAAYGVHTVRLQPLDAANVERLLASMLQMPVDEGQALAARLHVESGGNPFFVTQLVAALLDEGHLLPDPDGTWRIAPSSPQAPLPAPASVREAIGRRLDQLTEPARRLVEAAAVLAQPADAALLVRVADSPAAEEEPVIEELLAKRFLRLGAPPSSGYDFPHEVTRRVVYQAIPNSRRQALHRRALAAARARGADDEKARAAVPYHRARAGSPLWRLLHSPWARRGSVTAGTALMAGVVVFLMLPRSRVPFAERDWVILTDLENTTGDTVFDRSVNTAMTIALAQSQFVNVFPRSRVSETLQRMGQQPDVRLDERLAREVAQRENLRAVVTLGVSSIDTVFMLTATVVEPVAGAPLISLSSQAYGKALVLPALDDLVGQLRRALGEGRLAIRRRSASLPQATTSSLAALKNFAEAGTAWARGDWQQAQVLWEAAVALDSSFAGAHVSLGNLFAWLDERPKRDFHLDRALRLADRLPERERLWALARIAGARGNQDEAIDRYRAFLRLYPDDRTAWFNLATELKDYRQCPEALEAYQRVLAIDPRMEAALINAGVCHDQLGQYREAVEAFDRATAILPSNLTQIGGDLNRLYGFFHAKLGDTARAREIFGKLLSGDDNQKANGHRSLGLLEMYAGRYAAAIGHLREAQLLSQATGARLSELRNRLYLAGAYRLKGMERERAVQLRAGDQLAREGYMPPRWLALLAQHHVRSGDLGAAASLLDTILARTNQEQSEDRAAGELVKGELALARGDPETAIEAFELAYRLVPENLFLEAAARAYALNGAHEYAASRYQQLLREKSLGWETQEPWLLAHYELGKIYQQLGDAEKAVKFFRQFSDLWAQGDPDISVLIAARERLKELTSARTLR